MATGPRDGRQLLFRFGHAVIKVDECNKHMQWDEAWRIGRQGHLPVTQHVAAGSAGASVSSVPSKRTNCSVPIPR